MKKVDYYSFFAKCKPYIKFKPFLVECGISPAAFSKFLKGESFFYEVSEDKLQRLYIMVTDFCSNVA